jgi:hypothetical protein
MERKIQAKYWCKICLRYPMISGSKDISESSSGIRFSLLSASNWELVIKVFLPVVIGISWGPIWVKIKPAVQMKIMTGRKANFNIFRHTGALRKFESC